MFWAHLHAGRFIYDFSIWREWSRCLANTTNFHVRDCSFDLFLARSKRWEEPSSGDFSNVNTINVSHSDVERNSSRVKNTHTKHRRTDCGWTYAQTSKKPTCASLCDSSCHRLVYSFGIWHLAINTNMRCPRMCACVCPCVSSVTNDSIHVVELIQNAEKTQKKTN